MRPPTSETETEASHRGDLPKRRLAWLGGLVRRSNIPVVEGTILGRALMVIILLAIGFGFIGLVWSLGSTWSGIIERAAEPGLGPPKRELPAR